MIGCGDEVNFPPWRFAMQQQQRSLGTGGQIRSRIVCEYSFKDGKVVNFNVIDR
jgi:hypothetical protein